WRLVAVYPPYRLRFCLPIRCSSTVTPKLTTAPMAASAAVFSTSYKPSCASTLSSVPLPVPMLSCVILIVFPFLYTAFNGLQRAQCQGEVFGHCHHLWRQL